MLFIYLYSSRYLTALYIDSLSPPEKSLTAPRLARRSSIYICTTICAPLRALSLALLAARLFPPLFPPSSAPSSSSVCSSSPRPCKPTDIGLQLIVCSPRTLVPPASRSSVTRLRRLANVHNNTLTCPNPTSILFTSLCSSFGSHDSRFSRVCSGCFVGGWCHPSLFVIRWTWTSTPIPSFLLYLSDHHRL